jgi:hypothetical protein
VSGSGRDINKDVAVSSTQLPNVVDATTTGVTVDLAGFTKAMFIAHIGTITDGTFAFDPEESDDDSTWTNIAAGDLSGAFVNATSSADDRIQEVGYLGSKRYIRCNMTITGSPSTGGAVGISVVKAGARTLPQ